MEVRCDKCQARYRVDDARIGPQGLTMRCGKCQNTFKVMRPAAAAPQPAAPAKPDPSAQATMVFGQSPLAKPPAAAPRPAAPAPKPPAAKPAAPAAAAPTDEGAGRTMMFQTGNLKTRPASKPEPEAGATMVFGQSPLAKPAAAKPAAPKPADDSGSTMVFGQSPLAKAPARPVTPAKKDDAAGSTMMFGQAPAAAKPVVAPPPKVAEPPPPAAEPEPAPEPEAQAAAEPPPEEPAQEQEEEPVAEPHDGVEAEGAEEEPAQSEPPRGAFDKAPPKGLMIGIAAGLAVLLIAGGALVAVKKLGRHPPPPAAVETLTTAQGEADKDTLASIATAESKAKDAIDVAGPKSAFAEGSATLARIDVQWADALNDQAAMISAKGGDGSDAKATDLQAQAKAKLKAAFEAISTELKADKDSAKSPDLQLALADYYRAQRSNSNMNKALKSAQALKADDAKVSLVQGMALAQEDDGAEKAIPKLKTALAANPNSARVHFRLALAYQAMKDDANASAELKQVLKLSPQHERAKMATEQATATADGK
jgi:predicted Zn finger-like uncharacterized protein